MDRKIRILFLIDKLGVGGTERQLVELMRRLDPGKFKLFLGCLAGVESAIHKFLPDDVKVKTFLLDIGSTYSLAALVGMSRLIRFIRAESIDIVQCYFPKAKVIGCLAGKLAGAKTISCMRDLGLNVNFANMLPLRLADFCTDRFLVNSLGVKDYLVRRQRVRSDLIDVVVNGVDMTKYQLSTPAERAENKIKLGIDPAAIVIGVIANPFPVKGFTYFVQGAALVHREYEKTHFVIVGKGPQEEALRRQAVELRMGDKFLFSGRCDDVGPYLRSFDIGVLCSLSEGFSNSILEYMAAGLPVVATRVGGNQEQVRDGVTGFLVPPGESQALAHALIRLVREENLRVTMSEKAIQACRAQFSMDRMIARMDEYYTLLVTA
jgi:L-malate glycosyltransferase